MSAPLYLIATIAGERVAIAAETVESVVDIVAITPVSGVAPHVSGLAALRSRVITIIDSQRSLGLGDSDSTGQRRAIVTTVDAHVYGLLVDDVADVVAIPGLPQTPPLALAPGWTRAARGIIEHRGELLLLIDPAAIVCGPGVVAVEAPEPFFERPNPQGDSWRHDRGHIVS